MESEAIAASTTDFLRILAVNTTETGWKENQVGR